jgi:hypothetical protein
MVTRASGATLLVLAVLALTAPAASAGPIVDSVGDCGEQPLDQVFLPWADIANYTLLPGGDFEARPRGWALAGGADVVRGNEQHFVGGRDDARSLNVPSGSRVTSTGICVGLEHPTIRFFAKRTGGGPLAGLLVEVLFEDASGAVHALPIGLVGAGEAWQPTPPLLIVANLLPLLPGERTAVAFRLTPTGGSFAVDDVYVDPWAQR